MAGFYGCKAKDLLFFSFVLFIGLQDVSGFDCEILGGSVSCPTFLNSNDKKFCCQGEAGGVAINYCCDAQEFLQMKWVIFSIVGIVLGILLGCCLCGCCCYRRRTRGAVYGRASAI